jgi:hypothetical protein
MRREQEFGGDQIFQGAADALENCDFFRAASSLLCSTHQLVKIGGNVAPRDRAFLQGN